MSYLDKTCSLLTQLDEMRDGVDDVLRVSGPFYFLAVWTAEHCTDQRARERALLELGVTRVDELEEEQRLSAEDWWDPEGALERERLRRKADADRRRPTKRTGARRKTGRHAR